MAKKTTTIQRNEQNHAASPITQTIKPYDKHFANNSFSGTDMVAIMHIPNVNGFSGTYTLGSLQTITYSTHMDRSPIRSIGNVNAKDYVMGPRTVAGSLVFAVFDKHFAYAAMDEIRKNNEGYHFLADELPAFDITITMASEYGKKAKLCIYGVQLINEGQVMSVNDIFTENTYQFVAKDIDYLSDQTENASGAIYSPLSPNPGTMSQAIEVELIDDVKIEAAEAAKAALLEDIIVAPTVKRNQIFVSATGEITPGKVAIDMNLRQTTGFIKVYNGSVCIVEQKLTTGMQWPLSCELTAGTYETYYENEDAETSRSTSFVVMEEVVKTKLPLPPIQHYEELEANQTITVGLKVVDSAGVGIKYAKRPKGNSDPVWIEERLVDKDKMCTFKGLTNGEEYIFVAYNDVLTSDYLVLLLDGEMDSLFSDFAAHIYNNRMSLDRRHYKNWEAIWNKAIEQKNKEPNRGLVYCINAARFTSTGIDDSVVYFSKHATAYIKNTIAQKNLVQVMDTPILQNTAQAMITMSTKVKKIKVTRNNDAPTMIESKNFIRNSLSYHYFVKGKPGVYTVVAYGDADDIESLPLEFSKLTQSEAENEAEAQKSITLAYENAITQMAINEGNWVKNYNLNKQEKNELLGELVNDKYSQKEGVMQPIITDIQTTYFLVTAEVPEANKYYLCTMLSKDLHQQYLAYKYKLAYKHNKITAYANKLSLVDGERYSCWIEDENGVVVSKTTSFTFASQKSKQDEAKNTEQGSQIKKLYKQNSNQAVVENELEQDDFNVAYTLDSVMITALSQPLKYKQREEGIYDAALGRNKFYYSSSSVIPKDIKLNMNAKQCKLTYNVPTTIKYIRMDWYTTNKDTCAHSDYYEITPGQTYTNFTGRGNNTTLGLVISFLTLNKGSVTEPIVIDFATQKAISNSLRCEVEW